MPECEYCNRPTKRYNHALYVFSCSKECDDALTDELQGEETDGDEEL